MTDHVEFFKIRSIRSRNPLSGPWRLPMIYLILFLLLYLLPPVILVIMLIRAPLGIEIPGVGFVELNEKGEPKHE